MLLTVSLFQDLIGWWCCALSITLVFWPGSITCAPGIVLRVHHHRLTHGGVTLQSQGFQAKNTLNSPPATPTGQKPLLAVRLLGGNDYLSVWKSKEKDNLPPPSNLSFADSH